MHFNDSERTGFFKDKEYYSDFILHNCSSIIVKSDN